ncbi:MAG: Thioesterase superfamily protein [Candidatus Parvarchaeum acidophilus ARMAN-5_'5-way FS']|jgi:acyl-CoA thioester hydrolase|uniref:Thioesterase superfamily protein n=2 Tax=Parvarchaeum acidophilus TaxID=662761 RepID=D6GWU9_PARA5|nr:MAG: thioesterase superfamily protein [Candidatus Parvarchaeum acidophilus ARMAN-5]EGD71966.1 MAG: Thioesterase superfamily protein [Candidatus Parvarchaeum acidophilus ARMAN-5_'5-way FS']
MENMYSFAEDVKIYDTDAQGIVHYAGYYRFFTDAMQEFIRSKGYKFPIIDDKHWFVVIESNAKYIKSARLGETLTTYLTISKVSNKIIRFDFDIKRDDDIICQGYLLHICIDKNSWKSTEIPQELLDLLNK